MLRYYFVLMLFIPPSTWGQDSMANITAGEYRPLYLSVDSPLVRVASFKLDKQPVTNRQFQQFVS
jgi:formylglycine-generating enzyme required for sulfatase activity